MSFSVLLTALASHERRPSRRKRSRRGAASAARTAGVPHFPILPLVIDGPFAETKG